MADTKSGLLGKKLELERQLEEVNEELESYEGSDPYEVLAEELHSMMCKANHTDGCGWYYHKDTDYAVAGTLRYKYLEYGKTLQAYLSDVAGRSLGAEDVFRIMHRLNTIRREATLY